MVVSCPNSLLVFPCSLSQYSDENMMDSYNLAICFGPTLMPTPETQDQVSCQAHVNEVIKTIIIHHETIFPDAKELDGPMYEKCMAGGDYWWVLGWDGDVVFNYLVITVWATTCRWVMRIKTVFELVKVLDFIVFLRISCGIRTSMALLEIKKIISQRYGESLILLAQF